METEDVAVVLDQFIKHPGFGANRQVIDLAQSETAPAHSIDRSLIALKKRPPVSVPPHEGVDSVAICRNGRPGNIAMLILKPRRLGHRLRSIGHDLGERPLDIIDEKGNILDAVAMKADVLRNRISRPLS